MLIGQKTMYSPIENYSIIGNLRSSILISKEASIDWACAPFIDSSSVFAKLLDDEKGGFWQIKPKREYKSTQRYIKNTNVLTTEFNTDLGISEVTDFLPIEEEKEFTPAPENTTFKIHRKVKCIEGECEMEMFFCPRFNYARGGDKIEEIEGGVFVENDKMHGVLASKNRIEFKKEEDLACSSIKLKKGESVFFVFRYNTGEIVFYDEDKEHHETELEQTISYWQNWTHGCDLNICPLKCKWHEMVARSSLVLKALFFEPMGTPAAAATTSLPESIGGVRNWDYRFTWLRDSSFIFKALFKLGHIKEAKEYINWLLNICEKEFLREDSSGFLQVVYGLRGEKELDEKILEHLEGYKGAKPVRVGNGAYKQKGLDIYGSVFDMIWQLHLLESGDTLTEEMWKKLKPVADFVANNWNEPGEGLWEVRGGKKHFTYSKVMCWTALDRALKLADVYDLSGDTTLWWNEREAIKLEVMSRGFNKELNSFAQSFDSKDLDASVLLFPVVGFIKGDDPKMLSTIEKVREELEVKEGLIKRYTSEDGLPGEEGAFLLASFWLVQALVEAGKKEEAEKLFETVISKANHTGLFSEEIDEKTGEFLGNFPQAYTHVGLINSAFALTEGVISHSSGDKHS